MWNLQLHPDFLWIDKAPGFNTHAADPATPGIVELLSDARQEQLWVVHRLDQGTSGALVFARNKESATRFKELFESHVPRKTYVFLTKGKAKTESFEARSRIEKQGSAFVSLATGEPNSRTHFRRLRTLPAGDLWEAKPETGKPHQIRLHAADHGLPILGDFAHGGPAFHRLALHAQELIFPWNGEEITCRTSEPAWATDAAAWSLPLLEALQNRERLFSLHEASADECLRMAHTDADPFRIDRFGSQWWVSMFREKDPTDEELKFFDHLARSKNISLRVRHRQDRGKDPNSVNEWTFGSPAERWQGQENGIRYAFRADAGQSAGLFLDQRENRAWVRENSQNRKVLNLFSYTGAFSVNAAMGGADEVCTVDVSRAFNEWAQENFAVNELDPKDPRFEFWAQDVGLFVKGAVKRGRKWDLIICDPPSFGRSREGVFQIAKHLPALVSDLLECLNPAGQLLLSCNYEEWTTEDLMALVQKSATRKKISVQPAPRQGLDFERPGQEPLMKAVLARRQ